MGGGASKKNGNATEVVKQTGTAVIGERRVSTPKARPAPAAGAELQSTKASSSMPQGKPQQQKGDAGAVAKDVEKTEPPAVVKQPIASPVLDAQGKSNSADARSEKIASTARRSDATECATLLSPKVKVPVCVDDFHAACRIGDVPAVSAFLADKARTAGGLGDCDGRSIFDRQGDSVLHLAARGKFAKVVELLLSIGRLPADLPNAQNDSPLQVACQNGDVASARLLLEAGADPNRRCAKGLTPFMVAAISGAPIDMLDLFVAAHAEVDVQDDRGVAALHLAALRGNANMVSWLLQHGAVADVQTNHGCTPLMLAVKRGSIEAVASLLEGGASLTPVDDTGCAALAQALSSGQAETAQMLLLRGAAVDAADTAGRTPLFHAVLGGCCSGISMLLERGCRVNTLDEEGRSPLYQSCLMDAKEIVALLLEAGADANLAGGTMVRSRQLVTEGISEEQDQREAEAVRMCLDEARTCIQVCATLGYTEILSKLLEQKSDIDAAPGALGWTALHICAAVGNASGVTLLLEHGAEIAFEDADGNTAENLAERAGHIEVQDKLREPEEIDDGSRAVAKSPSGAAESKDDANAEVAAVKECSSAAEPVEKVEKVSHSRLGNLPPLRKNRSNAMAMQPEAPAEEAKPLVKFQEEWDVRDANESLFDAVFGPMVHDALESDDWHIRLEAISYLKDHYAEVSGSPADIVAAVALLVGRSATEKVPKLYIESLALFEQVVGDSRVDSLSSVDCISLFQGNLSAAAVAQQSFEKGCDVIVTLLDQIEAAGSSSVVALPQQASVDLLCSCVMNSCVPLNEIAWPLLRRIDARLLAEVSKSKKDRKEAAQISKLLAANFRLLHRFIQSFGLRQAGLFRRALLLPLMLRGVSSEHPKVRVAAGDALVNIMSLSGGLEDRIWMLMTDKSRKAAQQLASSNDGVVYMSAAPCQEDLAKKEDCVAEDARASTLTCVSELNPEVWAGMFHEASSGKASKSNSKSQKSASKNEKGFRSKSWKERVESIKVFTRDLSSSERPVDVVGADPGEGCDFSRYLLCGQRLSVLQELFCSLLGDSVTAVFVDAADMIRLVCSRLPAEVTTSLLQTLLPALIARLLDTSKKVKKKTNQTILEIAGLHVESEMHCAGEVVAKFLTKGCERNAVCRLQLLTALLGHGKDQGFLTFWSSETWKSLGDCAVWAAEHRNGDVRKESISLLNTLHDSGIQSSAAAEQAITELQALAKQKECKRPGTSSNRPPTGSRLGTSSGNNASGRLSNLNTTGLNATGRLSTASRSGLASRGSLASRSGTAAGRRLSSRCGRESERRQREVDEESSNSLPSPRDPASAVETGDDGIQFFDVRTACPGADQIPDLAEADATLAEMLQLAEQIDKDAADFIAPMVKQFGEAWTRCFYSRHWQCRVAALIHLAAANAGRIESSTQAGATAIGELLDATMRCVHEGLGDQNVRVYAEACLAARAVIPAFCGQVDGRLLVAHLAPMLRQLCSRMADTKEVVRTSTTQVLFSLLRPPTGTIVSPVALTMLILRNLAPAKDGSAEATDTLAVENLEDVVEAAPSKPAAGKGAATGWLCRLSALRDIIKEFPQMGQQMGTTEPGEWLRLKDGLTHPDPTVRHESARLYALACKMHVKVLGEMEEQMPGRKAWVSSLPADDVSAKSLAQVRNLLQVPEPAAKEATDQGAAAEASSKAPIASLAEWQVPQSFAVWAACDIEVLRALRAPVAGDEQKVAKALQVLNQAVELHEEASSRGGAKVDEAFQSICKAIQQSLASPVGTDKQVFASAVDLCHNAVTKLAPSLSGLDINMSLAKAIPALLERVAMSGSSEVKVSVKADRLVQKLAQHPKVGCESATKLVITAIARAARPGRPLVLLDTLLGEYGLRLCAQQDIVAQLLIAIGTQLDRVNNHSHAEQDLFTIRSQLIGVLTKCELFSSDTVKRCMVEVEPTYRKHLLAALQNAPNPRLVALGAAAAEQDQAQAIGHKAGGSGVRALARSRSQAGLVGEQSPSLCGNSSTGALQAAGNWNFSDAQGSSAAPPSLKRGKSRAELQGDIIQHSNRVDSRQGQHSTTSLFSEVSTAASTNSQAPWLPERPADFNGSSRSIKWGPPDVANTASPMGTLTRTRSNRTGDDYDMPRMPRKMPRSSSEAQLKKGSTADFSNKEGLGSLMEVLSQVEGGRKGMKF